MLDKRKKTYDGLRETQAEGLGWELFRNYLIAKKKFKPDFFLYENNQSAAKGIKNQIAKELDENIVNIDSNLVSAQNRKRFYVFNWNVELPKDKHIFMKDILDDDVEPITVYRGRFKEKSLRIYYDKAPTVTCATGGDHMHRFPYRGVNINDLNMNNWKEYTREIRVHEVERLQTLPDGYTRGVSKTRAFNGLGNGWTADVIIHILYGALKNIPKDEEILVLSMYDGIGTGRYCLDKMGFTNVKYYAYEVDKYAIQIATNNYPDIIQMGDAFAVRNENWRLDYGKI